MIGPTQAEIERVTRTGKKLLEAAFGKEPTAQMMMLFSDPASLLRQRRTTLEVLRELAQRAPKVDESRLDRIAASSMKDFDEIARRAMEANPLLQLRAPMELRQFLQLHARHVDSAKLEKLFDDGLFEVFVPAQAVPSMILSRKNLFEPAVEEGARILGNAIEHWYKQLLIFLVELTYASRAESLPAGLGSRTTLGGWMKAARGLWKDGHGPVSILQDKLRDMRNTLAHEKLEIDVRNKAVRSPMDASVVLNRRAFTQLVREVFLWLTALWLVLRVVEASPTRQEAASRERIPPDRGGAGGVKTGDTLERVVDGGSDGTGDASREKRRRPRRAGTRSRSTRR